MISAIIQFRLVGRTLAWFILALAGLMLVPLGYAVLSGGADMRALSLSLFITAGCGGALLLACRNHPRRELKLREAILLTSLIWVCICLFGSLPLYFSPCFGSFSAAFFESASGFTTTGATVLADVERLSAPIQLWRCFSQWLGGMGVVMLGLAVLPLIGQGGTHLYRAEFSGAKSQRLATRSAETARALWKIYLVLTLAEIVALKLAGMNLFEAVCHTFTTLATGGFSTRTASVAAFHSAWIDYIITLFMLLSGISFIQYYRLLVERDRKTVFGDYELRAYLAILLAVSAVVAVILYARQGFGAEQALRAALFQVTSIITTTGFTTYDFSTWYPLAQILLLMLMFVGGCTGSTAGGVKVSRTVLMGHVIQREFKRMAEPQGIFTIRSGGEAIPEQAVQGLLNLVYLAWLMLVCNSVLLAAMGIDVLTALSASFACLFNVGPGLGAVGPAGNYGGLPAVAQWALSFCMIAGRLECYTLVVLLTSAFWRR